MDEQNDIELSGVFNSSSALHWIEREADVRSGIENGIKDASLDIIGGQRRWWRLCVRSASGFCGSKSA